MANPTYEARIMLKNSKTPLTVQVVAWDLNQAKQAIEGMYGGNFKSWVFHPYMIIDENGRRV